MIKIKNTKKKHTSEYLQTLSFEEIEALIEKLEKDKIELEMKNERLRQTQTSLGNTKEYEQELMSNNEAQNKMLFLQSKYASMGETVGNIAHQWKQPLNAIGSIQNSIRAALIFQGDISKNKLLESVETSFKLVQHLGETIDTFYGFLSQRNSTRGNFTISDELETIRKITEYSFQNSNIKLIFKLEINSTIEGNPNEFTHAMLNLILNAKRALDNSKPKEPHIIVMVTDKDDKCTITVSDNAGGILIKPIDSIFDWHVSSKEDSSGVGLYMTKSIIEKRFGGKIQVENQENGACFTIELPYAQYGEYFTTSIEADERPSLEEIKKLSQKIIELEELEKTLRKWADIFQHARWAIVIRLANSKNFEMTNPAFNALYGYTDEELKNISVPDLFAPHSLDILQQIEQKALESGYGVFEAVHKRKDGSYFPVSIELIVIKNEYGEILYHIANIWDLSEKKEIEERLKLKKFAIDNIKEAVFLADENGNFAYVNDAASNSLCYSKEELLGMSVADVDPNWPKDRWPEFWNMLKQNKTSVVEVMHKRRDGSLFPVEIRANYFEYDGVGYNLGFARDITEQKASQKELLLLGMALNNTNEAIYIMIKDKIVQVNDGACNMLNYSREELTSMSILDIDANADKEEFEAHQLELEIAKIKNIRFERQHRTKDGHILDVEIVTTYFEYDEVTYSFSAVRDITEQKKAKRDLLLKEFALDKINEAVYLIDENSMFHYVNEGASHALGYTKEELLTMGVIDIDQNFQVESWKAHWESIKKVGPTLFSTQHKRKDGTIFPVEINSSSIEYNGVSYRLATARDITERLLLEEQKDNERMRLFFERQLVGMAITSPEKGWLHTNEKLQQMLDYTHEELTQLTWAELTYPEDLAPDVEQFEKLLQGEIEDYMLEKRFIRKDGTLVYTNLAVSCVRNDDGSVNYVLALMEDITERKEIEEALVQKEREYRTLAENSPDLIYRYDRNHRRLYVNPTACKIVGKSAEELLDSTPDDGAILVSQQSKIVNEQIERVFATGESVDFMVNFIEKNGDSNDYHMLMVPEYDTEGKVTTVLGYTRNVTEIRSLERRQSQYFAMAPGLFATVLKDADGNYSLPFVSEGIRDVYGIEPETAMQDISAFVAIAHPDDIEMTFVKTEESAQTLTPYRVEYRINHPHKGLRWIECNGMPQRLPDGGIRWDGFYHDITERKQIDKALHSKSILLQSVLESSPNVTIFALDTNYNYIAFNQNHYKVINEIWGNEIAIGMNMLSSITRKDDMEKAKELFEKALNGNSFIDETQYSDENLSRSDWQTYYAPMYDDNGKVTGLTCFNLNITERKQMEALLEKEHKFLTDAQRVAHTGSWYLDIKSGLLSWSDETYRIFELKKENIDDLHKTFYECVHPDDREMVNAPYIESLKTGIPYEIEHRIVMRDGRIKYVIERCEHAYDSDGKPLYSIGTVQDITERKLLEKELEDSYHFLNNLIDSIPDPIFVKDRQHTWTLLNKAFCDLIGETKESLLGKSDYDFFPKEQADVFWEKDEIVYKSNDVNINEEFFTTTDGAIHYIQTVKTMFTSTNKEHHLVGIIRDITERKEMEEKLRQNERSLKEAQKIAKIGSWELDIPNDTLTWSDETYRIFELDNEQTTELYKAFYKIIHPDDKKSVQSLYVESVKSKLPYEISHRIVMPDGRIKHVLESCETQYDKDGNPVRSIGTVQDITERKQAEDTIKALNETLEIKVQKRTAQLQKSLEFNEGIIHAIPDLLFEVDYNGKYLNVWAKNAELLAAQKEMLLGRTFHEILSPEATAIALEAIKEANEKELSFGKTIKIDLPHGEHWFELSVSKKGSDNTFIVISRDITERKEAEVAIKELNANLEKRVLERTKELQKALEFNEGIINAIPDLLFEISSDGIYVNIWARDEELLAVQKEFLLGKNFRDVLPKEAVKVALKTIEEVDNYGSSIGNLYKLELHDGEHWFELSMSKKESGNTYLALSRDVTERKRSQEEIQELNFTLEKRVYDRTMQLEEAVLTLHKEKNKK